MIQKPGLLLLLLSACAIQLIWLDPEMRAETDDARFAAVSARAEAARLRSAAPFEATATALPSMPVPEHPTAAISRIGAALTSSHLVSLSSAGIRAVAGQPLEDLDLHVQGRIGDLINDLDRLEVEPRRIGAAQWSLDAAADIAPGAISGAVSGPQATGGLYNLALRVAYLRDANLAPPIELLAQLPDSPVIPASSSPVVHTLPPARSRPLPVIAERTDRVQGVLISDGAAAALVDGKLMKAGDWFDANHRIEEVGRDALRLRRRDGRTVRLLWTAGV